MTVKFQGVVPDYVLAGLTKNNADLMSLVEKDAGYIKGLDPNLISYEMAKYVLSIDPNFIEYIPEAILDEQTCYQAAKDFIRNSREFIKSSVPVEDFLEKIPQDFWSHRVVLECAKANVKSIHLLGERLTPEFVLQLSQANINVIKALPIEYQTKPAWMYALNRDGMLLRYVPEAIKDDDLIKVALSACGYALKDLINSNDQLEYLTKVKPEYLRLAMKSAPYVVRDVEFWISAPVTKEVLKIDPMCIRFIPLHYLIRVDRDDIKIAMDTNVACLRWLPEPCISRDLVKTYRGGIISLLNTTNVDDNVRLGSSTVNKIVEIDPDLLVEVRDFKLFKAAAKHIGVEFSIEIEGQNVIFSNDGAMDSQTDLPSM